MSVDTNVGSEFADLRIACGYDLELFEDRSNGGVGTKRTINAHGGPFVFMAANRQSGQKGW